MPINCNTDYVCEAQIDLKVLALKEGNMTCVRCEKRLIQSSGSTKSTCHAHNFYDLQNMKELSGIKQIKLEVLLCSISSLSVVLIILLSIYTNNKM